MSTSRPTPFCLCKPFSSQGCQGKKPAVDNRLTTGSSAVYGFSPGREALFVPGCPLVDRRLFVFANPSHPKDVRETLLIPRMSGTNSYALDLHMKARTSEILCKPNAGTKSAVDNRFIRGLSTRREALFDPGCPLVDRRLVLSANSSHFQDVWE